MHAAVDQLVPAFLDRLDALGVPEATRPCLVHAVDELVGYLLETRAAAPTRTDLQRFWHQRASSLDPRMVSAWRRALHIVGELMDRGFSTPGTARAETSPGARSHGSVFGHELRTGEANVLAGDTSASPLRIAGARPVLTGRHRDVFAPLDESLGSALPARARRVPLGLEDELEAPPQLELCHNLAGWLEVIWRGFVSGRELQRTLGRAWRWCCHHPDHGLLLNLRGASLLAESDVRWLQRWLKALQREPLARVALIGEPALLERLAPPRLERGRHRIVCFDDAEQARDWLEQRHVSGAATAPTVVVGARNAAHRPRPLLLRRRREDDGDPGGSR